MNVGVRSACYLCGKPVSIYHALPNMRCVSCGRPFCMDHGINFAYQPCLAKLPEQQQKIEKKLARNGNPGCSSACLLVGCPMILALVVLILFGAYTKGSTFAGGIVLSVVICCAGMLGGRHRRFSSAGGAMERIKIMFQQNTFPNMIMFCLREKISSNFLK